MPAAVETIKQKLSYCPNTGKLFWRHGLGRFSGKPALNYEGKRGYLVGNIRCAGAPCSISAHRAAWVLHYGNYPSGQIDHINGDRTDNRISNLRDVVNAENARNMAMKSNNTSGVTGVYCHSQTGRWTAQINVNGKTIGLGCFASKSDAIIARKAAERVLDYHPNHGKHRTETAIEGGL